MTANKLIGMVGLGLLGSAMAERFLKAGFDVIGFDIERGRMANLKSLGGQATSSVDDVATAARRIVLSLPTSEIAGRVIDELLPSLEPGSIVVDTTTGDPEEMSANGSRLAEAGVDYLDSTVGGSSQQTADGDVVVTAGGTAEAFAACRDLFDSFSRETFHVGPCGHGARMKLVVNLVLGLNRAVLAEGLAFANAMNLDPAESLKILKAGPAWSRAMDIKGEKMLNEDFTPQARLSQHLKDVCLILNNGRRRDAKLPFSTLHRELLEHLVEAGYGDADNSAVIKAFQ